VEETDRRHFVAVTTWDGKQAYDAWLKSESFADVHAGAQDSPIESTVDRYEVLS
jgi:heme-degrading monooxygenase HmoA